MSTRRTFLQQSLALAASPLVARADDKPLIQSIEKTVLRADGAPGPLWFHPRACRLPSKEGDKMFMTLQPIMGSDYFGPVHFTQSVDLGKTWSDYQPAPPLGWEPQTTGWNEGVCDVTPEYHAPTGSVIALGHNVYYKGEKFERNQPPRWPVYAVWKDGAWGKRQKLVWDDPRGSYIYSNNCGQRVVLPDGDVMMSFTFGVRDKPRAVCGVRCAFNGTSLTIKQTGAELTNPVGRGLLEPSLTRFNDRFYITIRAEDNHGYVAVSDDAMTWEPKQAWSWDDGEAIGMATTQQHWLTHSDGLFLVYTRKDKSNEKLIRWRAPLFVAQVDVKTLRLIRSSERIVLPIMGDAIQKPDAVALNGNFNITNASPNESWVTDGSWCPRGKPRGELALARLRWNRPNQLVGG